MAKNYGGCSVYWCCDELDARRRSATTCPIWDIVRVDVVNYGRINGKIVYCVIVFGRVGAAKLASLC